MALYDDVIMDLCIMNASISSTCSFNCSVLQFDFQQGGPWMILCILDDMDILRADSSSSRHQISIEVLHCIVILWGRVP